MVKTQGRQGEIAADLYTDFPELFATRRRLFALKADGTRSELELEDFWAHKQRIVLKLVGIDSISAAETLIGCEIQIPRSERAPIEGDTVYISDLKGCAAAVVDSAGERTIGDVVDVIFGVGEAPLLVVHEGAKEYLIPFASEYVMALDTAGKRIVLELPAGMLDLDAPLSSEEKRRQQAKQDEQG